jgi:hypothetical protein
LAGHDAGVTVADLFKPLVRESGPEPPGDSWLGGGSRSAWAMAASAVSPGLWRELVTGD